MRSIMIVKRRKLRRYDISILRDRLYAMGKRHSFLAEMTGLHKVTISRVLTGATEDPASIKKIADVLGVNLVDIVVPSEMQEAVA